MPTGVLGVTSEVESSSRSPIWALRGWPCGSGHLSSDFALLFSASGPSPPPPRSGLQCPIFGSGPRCALPTPCPLCLEPLVLFVTTGLWVALLHSCLPNKPPDSAEEELGSPYLLPFPRDPDRGLAQSGCSRAVWGMDE